MEHIVFFDIEEWEEPYIHHHLQGHDVVFVKERLTAENVAAHKDATIISAFIYSDLTKEVLSHMPPLKLIATRSTGVDHIDMTYCKEKKIRIVNVPSYGATTVAEHTFMLILALARHLILSVEHTRHGDFSLEGLTGMELSGKTIGIIGAGNIGSAVARISHAFGMKVLVYSHHDPKLPNTTFVGLPRLLEESDVVTLHVPLTPETKHMINMKNIMTMKKGSLLINTARGGLIETEALLQALDTKILAGAGIDVLEEECYVREERELLATEFLAKCDMKTQLLNHVLLNRDDVIVTPHNAFNSTESLEEILKTTVDNISSFLKGKAQNSV